VSLESKIVKESLLVYTTLSWKKLFKYFSYQQQFYNYFLIFASVFHFSTISILGLLEITAWKKN